MTEYILLRARRDGAICDKDGSEIARIAALYNGMPPVDLTPAIVELPSEKANVNDFGYAEGRAAHENSRIDGFNACITDMEDRRDGRA